MSIAERIFYGFSTAGDVYVVVERIAGTSVYDVLPVVCFNVAVEVHVFIIAEVVCVRAEVVLVLEQCKLILPLCVVVGAEHVHLLGYFLPAVISIVAYVNLAALAALGGYEDYTVCTT